MQDGSKKFSQGVSDLATLSWFTSSTTVEISDHEGLLLRSPTRPFKCLPVVTPSPSFLSYAQLIPA